MAVLCQIAVRQGKESSGKGKSDFCPEMRHFRGFRALTDPLASHICLLAGFEKQRYANSTLNSVFGGERAMRPFFAVEPPRIAHANRMNILRSHIAYLGQPELVRAIRHQRCDVRVKASDLVYSSLECWARESSDLVGFTPLQHLDQI